MSSPQCSNTGRVFWYSLHLSWMESSFLFVPEQILEYEDAKNDTQYEEYEEYKDSFDFAERDRAETWNREVNLGVNSHKVHQVSGRIVNCLPVSEWVLTSHIYSSVCPPQVSLRGEKGQKGEPAIIEPVSCWRHSVNWLVDLVIRMGMSQYLPNVHLILFAFFLGGVIARTPGSPRARGKPLFHLKTENRGRKCLTAHV